MGFTFFGIYFEWYALGVLGLTVYFGVKILSNKRRDTMKKKNTDEYAEDEDRVLCNICKKDITEDDSDNKTSQYTCEECDESVCDGCSIFFDDMGVNICKTCIDKVYPREGKVVEKIVEKYVTVDCSKMTTMSKFNPDSKTRFD